MRLLRRLRQILAEVMGDSEYVRYRAYLALHHPEREPLPPQDFYVLRLKEKYTTPSRCC